MQFKDWLNLAILALTIVAIIVGPIAAVWITVRSEERRERIRRKYQTFLCVDAHSEGDPFAGACLPPLIAFKSNFTMIQR
jgi:hypothetical protein